MRKGLKDALWIGQLNIANHLNGALISLFFGNAFVDHWHFDKLFANFHYRVQ